MNKRIGAAFIVMLFALGIVSVPVSAHFTLGEMTGTYRYHIKDYDRHQPGVIGYVWPGIGSTTGDSSTVMKPAYPGYMSPYPGTNPGTQGSGYGGSSATSWVSYPAGWYQLDANNYAPFGAILANTIKPNTAFASTWWGNPTIEGLPLEGPNSRGDLVFAFNATESFSGNYTEMWLWIPPEFTNIKASKVVASWTNNYDAIQVKRGDLDRNIYGQRDGNIDYWTSMYAPGWTCVRIHADRGYYYNETYFDHASNYQFGGQKDPALKSDIYFYPRIMNFTHKGEWYYLALNDVVAPAVSGRYFFKVGFKTPNMTVNAVTGGIPLPQYWLDGSQYFEFMPIQNWPVLTVKGEIDPAIMTGNIRFGGYNLTLYGQNVTLSGRVRAVGIADDPYTGKTLNKPVEARGYFNQTAKGHYEVEGVAPGVYDVYASCAGYPEMKIASGVKIQKGQSYHIDGYLTPGAVVHGTAFSKCGEGEVKWAAKQPIKIEIYAAAKTTAADVAGVKPSDRFKPLAEDIGKAYETSITKTAKMPVTWSPWGTASTSVKSQLGEPTYVMGTKYGTGLTNKYLTASHSDINRIQFPWFFPPPGTGYVDPGYDLEKVRMGHDPYGVGPAQTWYLDSSKTYFEWKFGDQGKYGAPCDWTGMVPEYNATWVGGLPAGQYYVRGWTLGYVQVQSDGVTFEHASFTVAPSEFPGDINVPFDLRWGSTVSKTIHFHDVAGTLTELGTLPKSHFQAGSAGSPMQNQYKIRVRAYVDDAAKFSWGYDGGLTYSSTGPVTLSVKGRDQRGYDGRSYGIPAGDYKVRDSVEGFVQDPADFWVSLGLCGTTVAVSNHVYRGVSFNVSIFAKDWEHPTVDQPWKYDNDLVYVGVYKDGKLLGIMWTWTVNRADAARGFVANKVVQLNITNWSSDRIIVGEYAWDTGLYELKAFAYGYVQKKPVQVYATRGALTDILIKLTEGAQIPVTTQFKHESIFETAHWNGSMRVRVFDDKDTLVGEYLTSDPWHGYLKMDKANTTSQQNVAATITTVPSVKNGFKITDDYELFASPLNDYDLNYVPGVTKVLKFTICGVPDLRFWWYDASPDPVPAVTDKLNTPFDLAWTGYGSSKYPAPYGIDASPNYMGGWRLEVDFVPWYTPNTLHFHDTYATHAKITTFYPPPVGALYGESPKYIPENHLGPWELRWPITVPNNHLGGESSLYFEVDLRGSTAGKVQGYTWCDDWRSTSWAAVVFTGADGKVAERVPTLDGRYFAYLPSGQLSMTISHGGYVSQKVPLFVTEGASGFKNVPLERANVPIPEFPVAAVVLAFSLAASLFILRRRRK